MNSFMGFLFAVVFLCDIQTMHGLLNHQKTLIDLLEPFMILL